MNVISVGSIICLSTHSNELLPIPVFNTGVNTATGVTVTVTLPPGVIYSSDTASQGTYDDLTNTWAVGSLTSIQDVDNPETLELCLEVTDDTLAPFVITWTIDCNECPDQEILDDAGSRTIEGIKCSDFTSCFGTLMADLPEYGSMAAAILALGDGKPFLASLANTEGWSYRALIITPFP